MIQIGGRSVVKGIRIGTLRFFHKDTTNCCKRTIEDLQAEMKRFQYAKEQSLKELESLYEETLQTLGIEQAMIFEAHQMMLRDLDYIETISNIIMIEHVNAEYAVFHTGKKFADIFCNMDNEYMKARAEDVLYISDLLVRKLSPNSEAICKFREGTILLAEELSPSDIMKLDRNAIIGMATAKGSVTSHTAILTRTLGIPSLVDIPLEVMNEYNGKLAALDAIEGMLYIEPDEMKLNELLCRQSKFEKEQIELDKCLNLPDVTLDGKQIRLYANIGSVQDVDNVISKNTKGIGLFRSEFLYLESDTYPTEEEQFLVYKAVLEKMENRPVILRTMDIGADKKADYFKLESEENPALGYRAIRICLDRPELFQTQLRAIYRASAFGNAAIMFPMITDINEIRQIKQSVELVKKKLKEEKQAIGEVPIGIMIETPAAALVSDELAKEVDFFSIGTNDLTQYTLAVDRQNEKIQSYYRQDHQAVLRLIQMTVENAHKNGIWVGICGELASDENMTEQLLQLGIDELSVPAVDLLSIRMKIRETKL